MALAVTPMHYDGWHAGRVKLAVMTIAQNFATLRKRRP
jgi:hypothetical protein